MKLLFEPFWKNAVDQYQPTYASEKAIGLYIGGFCVIGLYHCTHGNTFAFVVLNSAIGVWNG